jgi:class 3 adenylate cyclase
VPDVAGPPGEQPYDDVPVDRDPEPPGPGVRPYVPDLLRAWQPTHGEDRHMRVEGTLAFVDISGFTRLTERLARQGNVGAEQMSDLLDATFSALLADARAQDADLVKWGGDAVLLLFSGAHHAVRACCAAFDMRATLRAVGTLSTTSGTVTLRMSVGVHSGRFDFYLVGDPEHHRELLVVGPEASRTAEVESLAGAGQVALSDRTAALLPARTHRPGPQPGSRLLRARPARPQDAVVPAQGRPVPEAGPGAVPPARGPGAGPRGAGGGGAPLRHGGLRRLQRYRRPGAHLRDGSRRRRPWTSACGTSSSATAEHAVTFFETDIDRDGGKVMLVAGAPRSSGQDEERMLRAVRAVIEQRRRAGPAHRGQPR